MPKVKDENPYRACNHPVDLVEFRKFLTDNTKTNESCLDGICEFKNEFSEPITETISKHGVDSPEFVNSLAHAADFLECPNARMNFLLLAALNEHYEKHVRARERQAYANHFAVVLKQQHDDLHAYIDGDRQQLLEKIAYLEQKVIKYMRDAKAL